MKIRSYLWTMVLISIVSLVALGWVAVNINPENSGIVGKILFYSALFFALSGFSNCFLVLARKAILGAERAEETLALSFRQGMLLTIFFLGVLVLKSLEMLVWWDALILFGATLLIEIYFISKK